MRKSNFNLVLLRPRGQTILVLACALVLIGASMARALGQTQVQEFGLELTFHPQFLITVSLPRSGILKKTYEFYLNSKLKPETFDPGVLITPCAKTSDKSELGVTCWGLATLGDRDHHFRIVLAKNETLPLSLGDSRIDLKRGVLLYGSSRWYPHFMDLKLKPQIKVQQNQRVRWEWVHSPNGVIAESLYLFGGPYFKFSLQKNNIEYQVLLLNNEEALAQRFFEVMPEQLETYQNQLGSYPFKSFSVVENIFAQTGYGMAGATLLGSQVIRLPFLFVSSLPHEILHNWWGNSVFINDEVGNWAEGLTTYQSDFTYAKKSGKGALYRMNQILKYQDYHISNKELPLSEFRYRHNDASQALGYGKSMMVFHMLKNRIGEHNFNLGLSHFFNTQLFQSASFWDLEQSFTQVSNDAKLEIWFKDWVLKTGQPQLGLVNVTQDEISNSEFQVQFDLDQVPRPYLMSFELPIAVTFSDSSSKTEWVRVSKKRRQRVNFIFPKQVIKIQLDPEFDVFRHVGPLERPPQLLNIFSAKNLLIYNSLDSWVSDIFSKTIQSRFANLKSWSLASRLLEQTLVAENLIILGYNEEALEFLEPLLPQANLQVNRLTSSVHYDDGKTPGWSLNFAQEDLIVVLPHPQDSTKRVVWIVPSIKNRDQSGFERLVTRLTHYSSTSILVLDGRSVKVDQTILLNKGELTHSF